MRILVASFLISILVGASALWGVFHYVGQDLPSPERLNTITPAIKTQVLDIHGDLIGEFYREDRSLVRLPQIPPRLVDAFLAVEDRRFFSHWGIDVGGVARAAVKNVLAGHIREGASTITQQLARNLFLTYRQTARRKVKEAVLALRIEQTYSKEEILEMYLNQIYFGEGAYGIQTAARRFFGKDMQHLTLAECATLAGIPKNPRAYSPRRHPERSRGRRDIVLRSMRDFGVISAAEQAQAMADSVVVTSNPLPSTNAPYFMELVRRYLEINYGVQGLYEDGLIVQTTLDLPLQQVAESVLEEHMDWLEKVNNPEQTRAEYLDAVEKGKAAVPEYLQGAVLTVDAASGAIRAIVGGRSFEESPFNRATQAMRQPGSAFKPFVYLTGIDHGYYPSHLIMDSPVQFQEPGQELWEPHNYDNEFRGPVTLRYALQKSLNVPTIKLQEEFGPAEVVQKAKAVGITSRLPAVRSLALGTAEVTLEEITYAYSVFANGGIRAEPYWITRIEDRSGRVLESHAPDRREVLDPEPVAILNNMLASVVDAGTGRRSRSLGFTLPAAGKTGTTDNYSDAWFIGYTPRIVTGVWVGFDQKKPIGEKMTGAAAALPIWTKVMIAATKDDEPLPFELPVTVVSVQVCPETGLPAGDYCPTVVTEIFPADAVPTETCFLHNQVFNGKLRERWNNLDRREKDKNH